MRHVTKNCLSKADRIHLYRMLDNRVRTLSGGSQGSFRQGMLVHVHKIYQERR
jgi:hypothetical protein